MNPNYNFKWTKLENDLQQWDLFLQKNPRGHCQQVSHYLKSFTKYPFFDFEVLIVKVKGEIVGGVGVVSIGIPYFKVLIAPSGPVIKKGHEQLFEAILKLFIKRAKLKKAFYCDIKVPIALNPHQNISQYTLPTYLQNTSVLKNALQGKSFPFISGVDGFRSITMDNSNQDTYLSVFNKFNSSTKRNIRKALKSDLKLKYASSEKELIEAYQIIDKIAKFQKYRVRSWKKTKDMYMEMISEGLCIVPCCYYKGKMVGALIVFDIGQRLTYISGGVLREIKDLKVGHFLQNEMIELSILKGYNMYDFGVAGNDGVTRFKKGFSAQYYPLQESRYWILNQGIYNCYCFIKNVLGL